MSKKSTFSYSYLKIRTTILSFTVLKVLVNSPQFARKADQAPQQQQVVVSKSVQDPVGVAGRNIITNVYLGGMGPGMVEYLHSTTNAEDEATFAGGNAKM